MASILWGLFRSKPEINKLSACLEQQDGELTRSKEPPQVSWAWSQLKALSVV